MSFANMSFENMSFENRVVWITGASSGIGEALAIELSHYGARLVLSARRPDELARVRSLCVSPDNHLVLPLDMGKPETFDAAVKQVVDTFGGVDMLVNNAGISQRSRVADTVLDVDRRIFEINYFGVVALTRAALPELRKKPRSQIVVISSVAGLISTPLRSSYAASKHALHGFFEALRAEEYDNGVRVLMVCPGGVRTQVSVNALSGDGTRHGVRDALQEQGMTAEQCADHIIEAVQRGRAQVIIAGRERLAVWLFRFWPGLYRRLIRKLKVT